MENLYEYMVNEYNIKKREADIVKNIIEFVYSRPNWGISYKSHALTQMLQATGITETEILSFLVKYEDKVKHNANNETGIHDGSTSNA